MAGLGSRSISAPKRNKPINTRLAVAAGKSLDADFSGVNDETAKYSPAKWVVITGILFYWEDTGDFDPDLFGVDVTLANGFTLKLFNSSDVALFDFLDGDVIKENYDLSKYTPDLQISANSADRNVGVAYVNLLGRAKPLMVDGESGEYVGVELDDDYSDLDEFHVTVLGYEAEEMLGS